MRALIALTATKNGMNHWHNLVDVTLVDRWISRLTKQGYTRVIRGEIFEDIEFNRVLDTYGLSFEDKIKFLADSSFTLSVTDEVYWILMHPRLGLWCIDNDGIEQLYAKMARGATLHMNLSDADAAKVLLRVSADYMDTTYRQ